MLDSDSGNEGEETSSAPITRPAPDYSSASSFIKTSAQNIKTARQNWIRPLHELISNTALDAAVHFRQRDFPTGKIQLEALERVNTKLEELDKILANSEKTMTELGHRVTAPNFELGEANLLREYRTMLDQNLAAYNDDSMAATSEEIRANIYRAMHHGEDPPTAPTGAAGAGGDDSDDEVEVKKANVDYKCPFSQKPLLQPVTSTVCKHSYNEPEIMAYLSTYGNHKCPVAGCSKPLQKNFLKFDKKLAADVKRHMKELEYTQLTQADKANDDNDVL